LGVNIGPVHQRTVDVGEVTLAIAEAGEGGRPFLLLHGFTGAKEDFTEWLDQLAEAGWHAVAPDHRGHGASSKPTNEDAYSTAILADDALALADALGWDHFALLGHSMGGFVAQLMAVAAPEHLDALVLMDTGHGPIKGIDPDLADLAIQIVRANGMEALSAAIAARQAPLETPAHRRVLAERPDYAEFGDRKFLATSPHLYAAIVHELLHQDDTLERLARLSPTPPTLVIVGEEDAPFRGSSKRIADAIAGAKLAVIPDAGHSPQFENSSEWWLALSSFLTGIDPG
jgi:pimeloyl-ACP methyl ester carboxylesterase